MEQLPPKTKGTVVSEAEGKLGLEGAAHAPAQVSGDLAFDAVLTLLTRPGASSWPRSV